MGDLPLRGSMSLLPLIVDSLFGDGCAGSQTHPSPMRAMVSLPEERRDVNGTKFISYPIRAMLEQGGELCTERRYTEFAAMHDEVHVALAQPAAFPVTQVNLPTTGYLLGYPAREELLQQYLDTILEKSATRTPALPTLTAFFRLAPYVATGVPYATCMSAISMAAPVQCLAMMRAHSNSETLLAVGAKRLLELARGNGAEGAVGNAAALLDAGAVEFLCATLRGRNKNAGVTSYFCTPTPVSTVRSAEPEAAAALTSIVGGEPSARAPNGSASGVSNGLSAPRWSTVAAANGGVGSSSEPIFAADAVAVLAALATDASSRPVEARQLLRRCGTNELLCSLMAGYPQSHTTQSACAALIAALVAADRISPPGVASHYDFEAVALTCEAMKLHRSKLEVQWKGCAALHALACRATALAEVVFVHDGVRLICKAMSTYRAGGAARLQASACGAIAALADLVPSCRQALRDYSAAQLIGQTVADFASGTEGGAAVFVCGVRALLTLTDLPPASDALLGASGLCGSIALEELMWAASQRHAGRVAVQGVSCEVVAALTRERLRLAAAGSLDVSALRRSDTVSMSARFVASALARHAPDARSAQANRLDLTCPALSAAHALVNLHLVCRSEGEAVEGEGVSLIAPSEMGSLETQITRAIAGDEDADVSYLGNAVLEAFASYHAPRGGAGGGGGGVAPALPITVARLPSTPAATAVLDILQ